MRATQGHSRTGVPTLRRSASRRAGRCRPAPVIGTCLALRIRRLRTVSCVTRRGRLCRERRPFFACRAGSAVNRARVRFRGEGARCCSGGSPPTAHGGAGERQALISSLRHSSFSTGMRASAQPVRIGLPACAGDFRARLEMTHGWTGRRHGAHRGRRRLFWGRSGQPPAKATVGGRSPVRCRRAACGRRASCAQGCSRWGLPMPR